MERGPSVSSEARELVYNRKQRCLLLSPSTCFLHPSCSHNLVNHSTEIKEDKLCLYLRDAFALFFFIYFSIEFPCQNDVSIINQIRMLTTKKMFIISSKLNDNFGKNQTL